LRIDAQFQIAGKLQVKTSEIPAFLFEDLTIPVERCAIAFLFGWMQFC
jgi:hypothetical protein